MDATRCDTIARALIDETTRRQTLGGLLSGAIAALGVGGSWGGEEATAKKKNKKRKKKAAQPSPLQCPSPPVVPLQCPAGHEVCAGICCSPDKTCVAGSCQCTTTCGAVCCLDGQVCLNANTHACGCDALSCPLGCGCGVAAGGMRVCYESLLVICDDMSPCASNFECPVGSACSLSACDSPVCFPLCTT
jgi:hypothetical protein